MSKYIRKGVGFFEDDITTLSLCPLTTDETKERNFSYMLSKAINFTDMILRQGKIAIKDYYTIEEAFILADIFEGVNYEWQFSPIRFIKMVLEEATNKTNYFEKWNVNEKNFINKIENLNLELAIGTMGAIIEFLGVSNVEDSMATELILEYFNINTTNFIQV